MSKPFRLQMAKQKAEALLRELEIVDLPVDPFKIAQHHDITVEAKPDSAEGVSGMLLRHGDNFGILYATHIDNEGFQRFSVAHELGHYFLDGHIDHVLSDDNVHVSRAGFASSDPYEMEADHFAAAFLMPSGPFKKAIGKFDSGLAAIEQLAALCKTSVTATAIRYTELTHDAIAIIVSTGKTIDFCFMSDEMKELKDITWPKKGTSIPAGSISYLFNSDNKRVLSTDRDNAEIDIMDWFGGRRSCIGSEEVVGLGTYGKTLTVITLDHQADSGEDEEDMEESWTPRFRR